MEENNVLFSKIGFTLEAVVELETDLKKAMIKRRNLLAETIKITTTLHSVLPLRNSTTSLSAASNSPPLLVSFPVP